MWHYFSIIQQNNGIEIMRTINRLKNTSYELVYSTRPQNSGNREENSGSRTRKGQDNNRGSRRGGMGSTKNLGNPSRGFGYFKEDKAEHNTPAAVIRKHQEIRERGEDRGGEDEDLDR